MIFNESYFKSLNYTNYLEREVRYKKMSKELVEYLMKMKLIQSNSQTIDYGCAVGFFAKGVNELGISCDGYDISEWAKAEAIKAGINVVSFSPHHYNVMFAFDVFEHMEDEDIVTAIKIFTPDTLLVRIPCSVDGKDFHLDISKRDPTHINCKTKEQWMAFFMKCEYNQFERIDLYTVYDTDGVMCYLCRRSSF